MMHLDVTRDSARDNSSFIDNAVLSALGRFSAFATSTDGASIKVHDRVCHENPWFDRSRSAGGCALSPRRHNAALDRGYDRGGCLCPGVAHKRDRYRAGVYRIHPFAVGRVCAGLPIVISSVSRRHPWDNNNYARCIEPRSARLCK